MGKHLSEILMNIYFQEHLHTAVSELILGSDCLKLCFWIAFNNHLDSVILQKYQPLSNQNFKQNLVYMPS